MNTFYEDNRNGSARWAVDEYVRAMVRRSGLYHGIDDKGRILRNPFDAHALLVAGSGSGKTASILMYNALTYEGPMLILDCKGEIGAVSRVATAHLKKHAYYINPAALMDLPNHTTDPLGILRADSPTLVPDAKMIAEMLVSFSGGGSARYFEEKARLLLEAVMIADAEFNDE